MLRPTPTANAPLTKGHVRSKPFAGATEHAATGIAAKAIIGDVLTSDIRREIHPVKSPGFIGSARVLYVIPNEIACQAPKCQSVFGRHGAPLHRVPHDPCKGNITRPAYVNGRLRLLAVKGA